MCCIVLPSSPSSEFGIEFSCFFWILYSLGNLLLKFQNFSQSVELVGNQFNRSCMSSPILQMHCLILIGSPSSGLGIERHCCCWILYYLGNLLKFYNFYQSFELVGNQFNRWLCGSLNFEAFCIISASSPSSGIGIERRLFCLIPYSLSNILVNFHIFFSTSSTRSAR